MKHSKVIRDFWQVINVKTSGQHIAAKCRPSYIKSTAVLASLELPFEFILRIFRISAPIVIQTKVNKL